MQSDEGGSYLTPYTQKIVSANWIIDVNIRAKTIKLLEVNITQKQVCVTTDLGNGFIETIPKVQTIEKKNR